MSPYFRRRLYEIIPGALIWLTLLASLALAFYRPLWMIYFIILFDLYWLLRIAYFIPFLVVVWIRYRRAIRRPWQTEAERLPGYERIRHVIVFPVSKESAIVVRETLQALTRGSYPTEKVILVLTGEERFGERLRGIFEEIRPEFESKFLSFFITYHPDGIPGEMRTKGANLHWGGKAVLPHVLELGLRPEDVIISGFDIDTIVHPHYLSCVTYHYLTVPEPTKSSYQPVPLYNNNLWESPAAVRVAMFGTTFWLMTEQGRPEGMMTFSSHSMSLRMLMDVDFWQANVVSEDSRIFLQGLARYHGHYRVTPIHLPVSMDTVMSGDYVKALVALYKQLRRWAWGAENFVYMMETFLPDKKMSRWTKLKWIFKQLEGGYTWATAPLLIFFLGYFPFWFAPEEYRSFAIFQNTPFTLQWLMRFSMVGLFVSASLSLTLLPRRPQHLSRPYAYAIILLQWALLPVTFILFGAIPAIDAQTRLMLGKYLGFYISPKRSVSSPEVGVKPPTSS